MIRVPRPSWLRLVNLIPACERADLLLEAAGVPDVPEKRHVAFVRDPVLARLRSLDYGTGTGRAEALTDSAGISWDELDSVFTQFFDEKEKRVAHWDEKSEENWQLAEEEAAVKPPDTIEEVIKRSEE